MLSYLFVFPHGYMSHIKINPFYVLFVRIMGRERVGTSYLSIKEIKEISVLLPASYLKKQDFCLSESLFPQCQMGMIKITVYGGIMNRKYTM